MCGEDNGGVTMLLKEGHEVDGRLIEVGLLVSCFRHFSEQYSILVFGTMICFSQCGQKGRKVAIVLSASPVSVDVSFGGGMPFLPLARPVEAGLIPRFLLMVAI